MIDLISNIKSSVLPSCLSSPFTHVVRVRLSGCEDKIEMGLSSVISEQTLSFEQPLRDLESYYELQVESENPASPDLLLSVQQFNFHVNIELNTSSSSAFLDTRM